MEDKVTVEAHPLHVPSLDEVAKILDEGLKKNFASVSVCVVDCPNLKKETIPLAAEGICGNVRLSDVGGVPYLIPVAMPNRVYNLRKIAEYCELPQAAVIGAGAGPCHLLGKNSEMIANVSLKENGEDVNTKFSKTNENDTSYELVEAKTCDFCVMGNLHISEGKPGKVLKVTASKRTSEQGSLSQCLAAILKDHYGEKPVGLGGTFLMETGEAKIHVMPHFSEKPLETNDCVNNWLKFFQMSAPFRCVGYLVSHDPGWDLRVEHFHGHGVKNDGGHYHNDVTPNDVSYTGYFNLGEFLYRIDRPTVTHRIGRE